MDPHLKKQRPKNTFSSGYLVSAFIILLLFSVVAVTSTVGTYRLSVEGSKNMLKTRALDLAVNLGFSLERIGLKNELLSDLVADDRWNELAFLILYDQDGTILLHSNPLLVGRSRMDSDAERVISEQRPHICFSTLATGEEVFVLNFPLHLYFSEKTDMDGEKHIGPENSSVPEEIGSVAAAKVYCLRVALHPYPARTILRRANFQLVLIGFSLLTLWVLTFFFLLAWRRNYRLEIRLRKQERMAALGEMAAVLAHEIRNPLSSIKGFAQFHLEGATDPDVKRDFSIIVDESRRLERLTTNLLIYARPVRLNEEDFDTERFCREIEMGVGPLTGRVKFHLSCEKLDLHLDREKLMQVALNLTQNAIEAVSEIEDGDVRFSLKASGPELVLTVEDNGPGLPSEIKEHVFEPFVTGKAKGTGLGLAIVQRLVGAMKGEVDFKDQKGRGTVVEVILPLTRSHGDPDQEAYGP